MKYYMMPVEVFQFTTKEWTERDTGMESWPQWLIDSWKRKQKEYFLCSTYDHGPGIARKGSHITEVPDGAYILNAPDGLRCETKEFFEEHYVMQKG